MNNILRSILVVGTLLTFAASCGDEPARDDTAARKVEDIQKRLKSLRTLPYTSITEEKADSAIAGVTVHEKERAWRGYNLYCGRIRSEVVLMDMAGTVVHKWIYPEDDRTYLWDHAIMLANGDVLDNPFYIGNDAKIVLSPVPLPSAVLLGALGLGTAGWRLRRQRVS